MDDNLIIKLLDKQETSIKNFIELRSAIVEDKVDRVIARQDLANDRLLKHDKKINDLEKKDIGFEFYQTNCPANKLVTRISKRKFWVSAVAITTVIYITLATIWHTIGFGDVILRIVNLL